MLESVLAGVLNRFLAAYVDNLNTNQLNIGIWSGDVKLKNLRLKKEALDKFRLPVDVIEGYLGDLTLSIPWSNLKGKPVRVLIENVYLLAVPTDSSKATPEEDELRSQAAKQEKLENAEMMTSSPTSGMSEEDEKKTESFTASLVTKIVDNLQIEIRNIHVRYEDNLSVPGHPFSAGLTLSNFSAVSTDENWIPTFINNSLNGIHKLAKLESLALYFDTDSTSLAGYPIEEAIIKFTELIAKEGKEIPNHQFVLKPVSGEGRLILNENTHGGTVPKTDAELLFKELGFVLDGDQYRDVLSMIDLFHFYIRKREYRKFRPKEIEDVKVEGGKEKARWKFALEAIRSEVHEKNRKWSWEYFKERRDDRRDYVALFKAKSRNEIVSEDTAKLGDLEKKLGYKDIRFYRSIARSELRKERAVAKQGEDQSAPSTTGAGGWLGWVGWGTIATKTEASHEDPNQPGLNDQQREELYKAIDWDEKEAVASAIDLPKEAMLLRVKAKLETGSFALKSTPTQKLLEMNFDGFQLDLVQRPENFVAELKLGGLRVFDGTCEGSVYEQIVRVKDSVEGYAVDQQSEKITEIAPEDQEADDDESGFFNSTTLVAPDSIPTSPEPFFSLKFEHNPLDERADNALHVRLRHLEIIYHRGYVEAIHKFFKPPESQLESVGALIDVASSTLEGIRKETRAGLEYALAQHKTVDLHLDLNAPIIIVPENMTLKECQHIVLDAGHISVRSDLADKAALGEVKAKENQEYQDEDYKRLESLMYDKYYVKLESAQLLMGPSLQVCLDALEDAHGHHTSGGELHILERTSLTFLAQNCILAQAPNLTRFKISGSLPTLKVNISDRKYKSMMKMIDVALPKFDDPPPATGISTPVSRPVPTFAQNRAADDVEYHLMQEDEDDENDGKDDGKDEFFDTEDIQDGAVNPHQKTFEFIFSVDRVQASIFRSNVDPSLPDRLLVNAVLEGFQFEFGLRPFDMSVDILLRSLYVEDKMVEHQETEFRHLVTSKKLGDNNNNNNNGNVEQNLVRIRYQGVQKISPEFMTVHEGIDKTVDVELSTINVIVTRGSILILFDWIMTTFTDGPNAQVVPSSPDASSGEEESLVEAGNDKLRVKVKLTSIVAVLNEDGFRLATLSLSAADVSVLLRSPTMRVAARLGNLTFVDDFSSSKPREMLSIQGDELADFQYETYDPTDSVSYPGHDTLVYLRSGSLQFTFIEEPVHRILVFFSKFAKMKAIYDAATQAAAQKANEMGTQVSKMHYDILIRTPIVVFPRDESHSRDSIIANLGEISLNNKFEVSNDQIVTKIQAGLRAVRLTSTLYNKGKSHSLQILDDVTIGVDVTLHQNIGSAKNSDPPATQVVATMSDVKMKLTEPQYGFLINLLQTIPRVFDISDEFDDDLPSGAVTPVRLSVEEDHTPEHSTVDLLPELASVARGPDGQVVQLTSSLELSFALGTIILELYSKTGTSQESLKDASLAKFSLNETGIKYKMLSNGAMEAEVVIRSFTVHDTRTSKQTKFREIIPATSHSGYQFMINFTQSGGSDKSAFANVTIDSPKVIFSLDPVFALLDFATSAFPAVPPKPLVLGDVPEDEQFSEVSPPSTSTFAFRVNVVSPTIVLLDNPERSDSEAVILSISQVQMAKQGTLALTVTKVGMFLCRMDKPKENIRFLDNFDITLSMDNRAKEGRNFTSIEIGIQPLILRVSFRDILLIKNIINRAVEMSNRAPAPEEAVVATRPRASTKNSRPDLNTRPSAGGRRRSSATRLQAQIIISKESLRATIDGFQLILIGDSHDLPMIDVKAGNFVAQVTDWSSDLKADVKIMPFINYFNLRVSHWEPLMDPWEFEIHVSRTASTGLLAIAVVSQKRLELNITSTFIELALTTAALLGREGDKVFTRARGANAPFLIRNRTGYPLSLWSEAAGKGNDVATERLDDGADVPWRFDDWRTMRENVSATSHNSLTLLFEGMTWDRLTSVSVDREGEHIYALRPKLDKVTHRLLCDVKLIENVKVVTFRSTFQVENRSLVAAEMVIVDGNGKRASQIYKILPGEDCAVPIIAAYDSRIKLRPDPGFGYAWSTESYHWQDLVKRPTRAIVCKSNTKEASFRFQSYAVHDKSDPLVRIYPKISLRLRAPVEVQNLLPHDVRYRVFDKNLEHNWTSFLRKGGISPIHIAELSHLLLLSVEVEETVFQRSEFAIINTDNPEDLPVESDLVLQDKEGLKLNLRVHYQKHPDSGGAFRVQVYSPYILINKTGCEFALKTKTFLSSAKNVAGQVTSSTSALRTGSEPFMFSFPTDDRRNRVLLRINDSAWSSPLSFETVGMETEVIMPSATGAEEIHIGLRVAEGLGDYKLTKVITIYPRFIVTNHLSHDIRFKELGSKEEVLLKAGEQHPLGFLKAKREPQLVLAYPGSPAKWSAPFKINNVGQNHIRVKETSGEESLIRTDTMLEGPCLFIRLEQEKGSWPFLLRNDSDFPITFSQAGDDLSTEAPSKRYLIEAQTKMQYAWDLPASASKQLRIVVGGRERLVNVLEIGSQVPFRFPYGSSTHVLSIDVRAEGSTQAIRFSNYAEQDSVFKLQRRDTALSVRQDSVSSSREGNFEEVNVEVVTTFSFGVSLEGIGISVVNKKMQELVYASFRGVTAKYSDSTTNVSYDVGVKWIQVDNQLFGGLYPILLYPSVIPKDGKELEIHPSIQACVIILKDDAHGVTYFKYASVLIQEMTIEVDEDFLFALLDFAKFSGATGQEEQLSKLTDESDEISEPKGSSGGGDVYFEVLHLQPIQLDLSFMRTDRVNVDQKLNTRNPFFFFVNALTMALGNVNDAPVRLNALVIENARLSIPVLMERLTVHYGQEFFGQLYRVLGSADFLGNPVGLFTNVSSGVADFFIQPYDSVMLNGNKDLGIGIARGAGSLAKKTVFGLSDSMAKFTGSIGKGLSAATLDKQYQSQRRMRQFRNKPKHALYGVTAGAASLFTSVASGFEGLATKPLEGAESGGAAGFFKGVGKGLVGVVTKPAVGLFDFANNITEGIRNTTTVFDQSSIDRVRLPRFTASDGILRPYQEREALGQNWLKNVENGKYFDETFVAHLDIPNSEESLVVILTTTRILLVKILKLKVGWDVPLSDLSTISLEANGITLVLRGGVAGPFLALPSQPARIWLFRMFEKTVIAHNSKRLAE